MNCVRLLLKTHEVRKLFGSFVGSVPNSNRVCTRLGCIPKMFIQNHSLQQYKKVQKMVSLQLPQPPVEGVQKRCSSVEASSAAQKKVFSCEAAIVALGEDPDGLGLKILQEALDGGQVARHAQWAVGWIPVPGSSSEYAIASTRQVAIHQWQILRDKFAADL